MQWTLECGHCFHHMVPCCELQSSTVLWHACDGSLLGRVHRSCWSVLGPNKQVGEAFFESIETAPLSRQKPGIHRAEWSDLGPNEFPLKS